MSEAKMRGLTMFISDIRNCTSRDAEESRVEKELAHIRKQFADKSIDGYGLKKYVWKLLYMYMLGYDIEIGHMEALKLITSNRYSEKNAGYMACQMLWNENTEFLRLMVQSVKKDLIPVNTAPNEIYQCLALSFVCNIGGQEFAESLAIDVQKLLLSPKSRSFVRKKAALTLLRLFRKYPDCIPADDFPNKLIPLLDDPNLGVVTSLMSLILGLISHSTRGFEEIPAKSVYLLAKLAFSKERKSVYRYYLTLCPWLQVKLLRAIPYFSPPTDTTVLARLQHCLNEILTKTAITKNVNKNNADHSILFESINVIIHLCLHGHTDLQANTVGLLGRFISIKEPNFRYLGLETMTRLAAVSGTLPLIRKHHDIILQSLQDPDVSIRKRALDLLYVITDKSNATQIVPALLQYLQTASYEMRDELVLKIAILAEKYATELSWYIDIILQLITIAGENVTEDIWYRVVQIVTNTEDLQDYAATKCYKFLSSGTVHENGIKVGAYILGEFGDQIKDELLTGQSLFDVLQSKFPAAGNDTKAILLSSYIKLSNTYPELKSAVTEIFNQHRSYVDTEIQQRACEYYQLNTTAEQKLIESVFDVMPNFTERESLLLKRIKKHGKHTTDRDVWNEGSGAAGNKGSNGEGKDNKTDESESESESESDSSGSSGSESDSDSDSSSSEGEGSAPSAASNSGSAKKSHTAATAPGSTGQLDILGGFDLAHAGSHSNNNSASSSGSTNNDVLFPAQNPSLVYGLYGKDSGVLYESRDLQIGMKLSIENNNSCKLVFYYGNRCPNTLKSVIAVIPPEPTEAYKIQVRPTESFEIPPKKQILHFFLIHCFKPFKGPIIIKIQFQYQSRPFELVLAVPIMIHRFIVPTVLEPQAFITAWGKYGNELQVMRKLPNPVTSTELANIQSIIGLNCHLNLVSGVEKSTDNLVAAGIFHTATKSAAGTTVSMPCLIRIETKSNINLVRLTIHSGHSSVSEALLHTITKLLNATEQ